jgi:hypothetical protein
MLTSLSSPPSLLLWLTTKAKAQARRSWPPSRHAPRPSSTSRPSTYPALPAAIRRHRRDPLSSPNPSRLRGTRSPVHTPARRRRRRSGGEKEELDAARGNAVRREDWSRPWEEPAPLSSSAPASTASTSPHRRHLPPRRRDAPPFFINACTTARGHQGENDLPHFVDAPAFEPRGNATLAPCRRAATASNAGHRARLA